MLFSVFIGNSRKTVEIKDRLCKDVSIDFLFNDIEYGSERKYLHEFWGKRADSVLESKIIRGLPWRASIITIYHSNIGDKKVENDA